MCAFCIPGIDFVCVFFNTCTWYPGMEFVFFYIPGIYFVECCLFRAGWSIHVFSQYWIKGDKPTDTFGVLLIEASGKLETSCTCESRQDFTTNDLPLAN